MKILFRIRICFYAIAVFPVMQVQAQSNTHSSFQVIETEYSNLTPFNKWTDAMQREAQERTNAATWCDASTIQKCAPGEWQQMIEKYKHAPLPEQLMAINDWGNEHPYIVDQLNWGMVDYWAAPSQFREVNGDCEDYAIAKYYSLRALGVPAASMRIMILQDMNLGGIIHAVLGVYDNQTLWILDNQIKQVRDAASIYHYKPVYAVNEEKWWRYTPLEK